MRIYLWVRVGTGGIDAHPASVVGSVLPTLHCARRLEIVATLLTVTGHNRFALLLLQELLCIERKFVGLRGSVELQGSSARCCDT